MLNNVVIAAVGMGILLLGILLLGIYVLVPAIVRSRIGIKTGVGNDWRERVLLRYQNLSGEAGFSIISATFAWVFAWFKMRLDPMFNELSGILERMPWIRTVLDIGCGYGVAGCAILEWCDDAKIFGIDPDPARVRAARAVFGSRGAAFVGLAPDFERPELPERFDAVFVLDVIHFISDSAFDQTLQKIHGRLDGGYLVIRSIIPPTDGSSWAWKFASIRRGLTGRYACHRSVEKIRQMMDRAGFEVEKAEMSGGNPEMFWFIARRRGSEETRSAAA